MGLLTLARITVPKPKGFGTRRTSVGGTWIQPAGHSLVTGRRSQVVDRLRSYSKVEIEPVFSWRPGVPVRLFRIRGVREKSTVFAICPWPNPVSNRHHADLTAPTTRAGTWTVCRLYVQVGTVKLSPIRALLRAFGPVRGSKLRAAQLALARKIAFATVVRGQVTLFSTS